MTLNPFVWFDKFIDWAFNVNEWREYYRQEIEAGRMYIDENNNILPVGTTAADFPQQTVDDINESLPFNARQIVPDPTELYQVLGSRSSPFGDRFS